jgi:heme/copper-type cytochrome/quinol oxidase subunit 4
MEAKQFYKSKELRLGVRVLLALAVLTAVEYFIGIYEAPSAILFVIAVVKAAAVLWYFMHFVRLFSESGGEQ